MTALPRSCEDQVASQDDTHAHVRSVLAESTAMLLRDVPGLRSFSETRPFRDRPSGASWRGIATMVHVSGLLVSARAHVPEEDLDSISARLDHVLEPAGFRRTGLPGRSGATQSRWTDPQGALVDLVDAGLVGLRMISGPFLPGSITPPVTTSPVTPPPRRIR